MGEGGPWGRVRAGASLAGDCTIYIHRGSRTKRADPSHPPSAAPASPQSAPPGFDFIPSSPKGWQVRGWEPSPREQRRQGPAADVRACAPVNEQQPLPGDCSGNEAADVIASCWTRGGGGGCPTISVAGLKENSLKFQQPERVALQSTRTPAPMSSAHGHGHTGWTLAYARTHTRVHTHAHSYTHSTSRCVGLKLLPSREAGLRWTSLHWFLESSLLLSQGPQQGRQERVASLLPC